MTEDQPAPIYQPIRIKKILSAGGACPYQIEALTEDDRWFYLRYRMGRLSWGVWPTEADYFNACHDGEFNQRVGEPMSGWPDPELFHQHLDGRVIFPEGFEFTYDHIYNE